MKLSREWATPLTIGSFGLMATTGVLMFFHLDTGLNKVAHEWLGWLMLVGVALHAAVNWLAFKRYFLSSGTGRAVLAASALVIAGSFAPVGGGEKGDNPPMLALHAVMGATVGDAAPLAGRSADELVATLRGAGFAQAGPEVRLNDLTEHNREREAQLLNLLFGHGGHGGPGGPGAEHPPR
jgi:Domain of unknown function (DUF4405)